MKPLIIILLMVFPIALSAQENTILINLETVLKLGGADNLTIKEYQQRQELAGADLSKAREWWLPEVYAGLQNHRQWGAAMNADGRFFLDVDRRNLWTGLGLNARWDLADGLYLAKAANIRAQAALHLSQAERNKALLESIEAYYDFLAAQLYYNAYEQLETQAGTIIQQVEVQVQAGMRYESELLLSKSNLNHLRIEKLNARTDYLKKSAKLVQLLNLAPQTQLASADTMLAPLVLNNTEVENFENAYANRPEIKAGELSLKSLQTERRTTTTGLLLPQLQVGAFSSQFGRGFQPVRPMFPKEYPNPQAMYPTSAIDISLMWRIPIGRIFYAGDLKQFDSRLKLQEIQIEQQKAKINEELISERAQISISQQQIEIAREGLEFAAKALEQNIQRQEQGLVRPFEILQTQEVFIKS
ncbi:MAG: TolC family protein [Bacteroidota bacterium]|nr:TolC family protein [Bacteroidota bacterium]